MANPFDYYWPVRRADPPSSSGRRHGLLTQYVRADMSGGWDLETTVAQFDKLYTRMTGLRLRLIQATRSGDESDPHTRELRKKART